MSREVEIGDVRGGLIYDFKQYNATYGSSTVLGTGNGFLYTYAPTLSVALTGSVTKIYDGLTNAALSSANYVVTGMIETDQWILHVSRYGGENQRRRFRENHLCIWHQH